MNAEDNKIAEYFVVAGLNETSKPLEEDLEGVTHKSHDHRKDPITDICIVDR